MISQIIPGTESMTSNEIRDSSLTIRVSGIVQGVGFRPFVYRIASRLRLSGYIRNMGGSEVEIRVEGPPKSLSAFVKSLLDEKPPPARIEEILIEVSAPDGIEGFRILPSVKRAGLYSMIPPDIAVCEECLREVYDASDRHYRYPFNSCVWCGPRFSMMRDVPYDRANTAMDEFPLCEECIREYRDPNNIRRFHAQGISCPNCGPSIWLEDANGRRIGVEDPLREVSKIIDEGGIVAIKGVGGYHIACLATDDEIVKKLRERKKRPTKPFALMALDLEVVEEHLVVDDQSRSILTSPERPILLLTKKEGSPLSRFIAPGLNTIGVMLPYTPLHHMILNDTKDHILIMTSGNEHNKPMCTTVDCARSRLGNIVDYFLHHNREIVHRVDDSVVRFTNGRLTMLRRSRGYAPMWLRLPRKLRVPVIAFGAELQNVGAVAFSDKVVLTQFIGDTDELENLEFLEKMLRFFIDVYRVDPSNSVLVADLHPRYASRRLAERWAETYNVELRLVQHHHAHIASVMVENKVPIGSKVVGIAMDGLGYGDDGTFWGGEVLLCGYDSYERIGGLRPQPMPGGDLATRFPVRMLIGILSTFMSDLEVMRVLEQLNLIDKLPKGRTEALVSLKQARKGTPLISSIGRVLDAVAALLNISHVRTYEGEPAMKLESVASEGRLLEGIEAPIKGNLVDTSRLVESLMEVDGDARDLAYTTLYLLGRSLGDIAVRHASSLDGDFILVSGGAAVNSILIKGIEDAAMEGGFRVRLNSKVPVGDGGIALGQVASQLPSLGSEQ